MRHGQDISCTFGTGDRVTSDGENADGDETSRAGKLGADHFDDLSGDAAGLSFSFNGLQTNLELLRDPLTPLQPLKGLLMDKGALEAQAMAVDNALIQIGKTMARLKAVHREFSLKYKCQYVTLTSITDRGKSAKFYDEEGQSGRVDRQLDKLRLEYPTLQRNNIALHWRANKSLAKRTQGMAHEFILGRRVHLFEPHYTIEYQVVREVFNTDAPHFYEVLAAFEQIRVTLNVGYKTYNMIGKDILLNLLEMSGGGDDHFHTNTRRQLQVLLESMDRSGKTQDLIERLARLVQ